MKIKKVLATMIVLGILIFQSIYANAEDDQSSQTQSSEASSQNVKIVRYENNAEVVIYTGPISGYGSGVWQSADFTNTNAMIVFDWSDEGIDAIYIYPIAGDEESEEGENENAQNTPNTSNQSQQLGENIQSTQNLQGNPGTLQGGSLNLENNMAGINNILSENSDLAMTSNIKINDVNVGEEGLRIVENGELLCNFNILNNSLDSREITLILATYSEDNKLCEVITTTQEILGESSGNIELTYEFDAENESIGKIMLWDNLEGMVPIRTRIDFSKNSGINAHYYNQDNRLLQIDKRNGVSIYFTYDNMGNMLSKNIEGV